MRCFFRNASDSKEGRSFPAQAAATLPSGRCKRRKAMPTKYEVQVLCDNCGRLVKRERVDGAKFAALAAKTGLADHGADPDDPASEDLIEEEGDRPIEALITHVPACSHCHDRL
jgi:hypothetical protein